MSAFNHPKLLKQERERREPPTCRVCGYDLTGLTLSTPCPECGTGREPAPPRRTVRAAASEGLILASRPEVVRFGAGFALLAAAVAGHPTAVIVPFYWPSLVTWVWTALASVWLGGVTLLLARRFSTGEGASAVSAQVPGWLALVVFFSQGCWLIAALYPSVWIGAGRVVLLGTAVVGLIPTMWALGELLEWGGDEATGRGIKWLLLQPVYVGIVAVGVLYVLPAFIPILPAFASGLADLLLGGSMLYVYVKVLRGLWGGVSMARWARVTRENLAGRGERLDEMREEARAELAAQVDEREREYLEGRKNVDKPVGLDDFQSGL